MSSGLYNESKKGVLFLAFLVIASLSVNEEPCEVDNVKVCDGGVKASREGPCECHQEVTPLETMRTTALKEMTCDAQVVGVAGYTPPARGEQLRSLLSCDILEAYSR